MKRSSIILFLAVLILIACKPRSAGNFETIDLVRQTVADTASADYGLLRAARQTGSKGAVAIIGEPEEAVFLAEKMLTSDRYDNITGRDGSDFLPDFAGERIAAMMDELHAPYGTLLDGKKQELREAVVRDVLLSLDTLCRLNSFNEEAVTHKDRAKVIVLASSLAYAEGYADVDTLFKMASLRMPVVTPVESMLSRAFEKAQGSLNVGVWAGKDVIASGAYQKAFDRYLAAAPKGVQASLSIFTPEGEGAAEDRLLSFLDEYLEKGTAFPLSVLLLDDYGVDVKRLEAKLEEIRRMETPEAVEYNKLIAPDFRFVDAAGAVISDIYRILRTRNLFTHDIAYPKLDVYQTLEALDGFVLVPSTEKNIHPEILDFINENTQEVKKHYAVQGKH